MRIYPLFIFIFWQFPSFSLTLPIAPEKPIVSQVQTFCYDAENPATVGQLTVESPLNGNRLVWYPANLGGVPLSPAEVLIDQEKYYAALVNNLGEESPRTETKVNLLNPIFNAPEEVCYGDFISVSVTNIPSTPQDFIKAHPELTLFLEDPTNNTAYFLREQSMGWTEAYNYIQSFGESAAMYVINSKEEEDRVYNALSAVRINGQPITGTNDYHFWLGLRQIPGEKPNNAVDQDWYWLDGRPLTPDLANWSTFEPNDCCNNVDLEDGEEDFGQFDFYDVKKWNDMTDNSAGDGKSWPIFEFNGSTSVRWGSYDLSGNEIIYSETSSVLNLNLTETTTFFIEVETNGVTCRREHTVTVNPLPNIYPISNVEFCDSDEDGDDANGSVRGIDLTSQNATALGTSQSASDYTIQYYSTFSDASNGENEILGLYDFTPDSDFIRGTVTTGVIFIKMTNNTSGCVSIDSFNIQINPLPQINTLADPFLCDDESSGSDTDGIVTSWDFRNLNAEILGGQDPADFAVSYHLSLANANNPSDNGITFPFTNSQPFSQEIFIRVTNNQTQCFTTNSSFRLQVKSLPELKSNAIVHEQCDDDDLNDGISLFNLHSWESSFSDNFNEETFEFYKDSNYDPASLILDSYNYRNAAFDETVYVKIISEFGCSRFATLNLRVAASSIPADFMLEYLTCDDSDPFNQEGTATFPAIVIDEIKAQLILRDPKFSLQDVDIDFYFSQEEALTTADPIAQGNPLRTRTPGAQEIWALITNKNVNTISCLGLKQVATLYVDPVAIPNPVTIDRQCDGDSFLDMNPNDGIFPFDTSGITEQILLGQSGVIPSFYDEGGTFIGNSLPNPFESGSQTITVYLDKESEHPDLIRLSSECRTSMQFELFVDESPFLPLPLTFRACDNGISDIDGIAEFDTSGLHQQLLGGQINMEIEYRNPDGSLLFTEFPESYITASKTIDVVLKNPINGNCTAFTQINFEVGQLPVFDIEEKSVLCENIGIQNIGLVSDDGREYLYSWSFTDLTGNRINLSENTRRIDVFEPGLYEVTLTTMGVNPCSRSKEIDVFASNIATIQLSDLEIEDLRYGSLNTLTLAIDALGPGDYEFNVDDTGFYQDEPYFTNLAPGVHKLFINDKNGCGTASIEFSIIGFHRFFTPNGDGYNDYWNVLGITPQFQAKSEIYIFDRFGKLITQIDPLSNGWDGTLNGRPLPDTDYWFNVKLEDGRIAKGHFSLIRGF
jgi:gliding motility-associated-like protein